MYAEEWGWRHLDRPLRDYLETVRAGLRTIRVRLTLWYVALLAVILVGFSLVLYLSLARALYAELDRSLAAEAQQIVSGMDLRGGRPALAGGPDSVPVGFVVALYDRTGEQLIANDVRQPIPVLSDALRQAAGGRQTFASVALRDGSAWRVLTTPVTRAGVPFAVLQVATSERDVAAALSSLVTLAAIAIPLTLLLASAGGLFLAGRALNPVDRIRRTAEAISAEDLSRRLDLPVSPDELGRLAATFDRMLDRLDRAFQRQRRFTADASHELRTPLALLIGEADVALERERTAAEYRAIIAELRDDAARLAALLADMLTLARADAGQETLDREPLDLRALAGDVVEELQPLARSRRVRLERAAETHEPIVVEGDQTRLTQLLLNLADNGIKYTPPGGSVVVAVRREGEAAVLEVADTGVGIAPEHLPQIFERFYRVDQARSRAVGGAGLGLAISRWIARAHGGDITVASRPGAGTAFTVRLPLATTAAPRAASSGEAARGAPDALPHAERA